MTAGRRLPRRLVLALCLTCTCIVVLLFNTNWNEMFLEDAAFLEGEYKHARRRIFFLETSETRAIGARAACAVESASRLHPLWSVHYLHARSKVLSPFCHFSRLLRTLPNVHLAYLHYTDHFKDTALDLWLREGAYKRGPYEVVHLSDGLRLALLLKHGGVYVDTDVVFLRTLDGVGDAVVAHSADDTVTNNFFAFPAHHPFIQECLSDFVSGYYPKEWGYNGPRVVRRILLRWCNATRVEEALGNKQRCHGVTLLDRSHLLPMNHTLAELLFEAAAAGNVSEAFAQSYLVHTFHSRTHDIPAQRGSFVERAAIENCPRTFALSQRLYGRF
ncbi:lactosylceramide 4-alpha-galactosyltransferase-like [Amblyomma americanum]